MCVCVCVCVCVWRVGFAFDSCSLSSDLQESSMRFSVEALWRSVKKKTKKTNYVSTLAVESDEFKGNRAHLRSTQWLRDIKQTERWDQY